MRKLIRLEGDSVAKALECAVRDKAQVVILTPEADTPLDGFFISADADALLIQLTGHPVVDVAALTGRDCEIQVHADRHYQFTSRITGAPVWGQSHALAVSQPSFVALIERRHFRRASLAPSSKVELQWTDAGGSHRHFATILNVSSDGLACKVDEAVASAIESRCSVSLTFQLPWLDEPYLLKASISNRTPASEGCTILGFHYSTGSESAVRLARLRVELARPRPAHTKVGVFS